MTEAEALALIPLWKKEFEKKYGRMQTNTGASYDSYGNTTYWVAKLDKFGRIEPFPLKEVIGDLEEWINKQYKKIKENE